MKHKIKYETKQIIKRTTGYKIIGVIAIGSSVLVGWAISEPWWAFITIVLAIIVGIILLVIFCELMKWLLFE